jgi:putative transposase
MIILECRLVGARRQYAALDEAIRSTQFIRNKSLRLWPPTTKMCGAPHPLT